MRTHNKRHRIGDAANWRCYYCGRAVRCVKCYPDTTNGFVATLDHYIPKSKGGSFLDKNLRLACPTCNNRKADELPAPPALTYVIGEVAFETAA